MPEYLTKRNQDLSYSVSIPAWDLQEYAFVDYYDGLFNVIRESRIVEYNYWFTKPGNVEGDHYPGEKGRGHEDDRRGKYARGGKMLEQEWRAALQSVRKTANRGGLKAL